MGYLKETGQLTPEKRMEIEHKINLSYQRLLTFEIGGGGFDWYGKPEAKVILSAYGLMLLKDMNEVYPIDTSVIGRAYDFLVTVQNNDGSWTLDKQMYTWHQLSNGNLPLTAYVTWALAESGYRGWYVKRAVSYIKENLNDARDPYVQALCANALVSFYGGKDPSCETILDELRRSVIFKGDNAYWGTEVQSATYSRGVSADIETTALAVYAFIKAGYGSDISEKALKYIIKNRNPHGGWGSTQATILSIKALLEASKGLSSKNNGVVKVFVNGSEVEAAFSPVNELNSDVMQQVNLTKYMSPGTNRIELRAEGKLNMTYQIVSRYYTPWDSGDESTSKVEPLTITVDYDKTTLNKDEKVHVDVKIRYNGNIPTFMVIADLGIPPGFEVERYDLDNLIDDGVIDRYELTGRQIIIYMGTFSPRQEVELKYRLRAKYPIKAKSPVSVVYEYYTPDVVGKSEPVEVTVH